MKYRLLIDNRPAAPIRDEWDDVIRDAERLGVGTRMFQRGVKLASWTGASIERIK